MKITENTLAILKNFASINPAIQFRKGNTIKTRLVANDLQATAVIEEEFPCDFAIANLPKFISLLSMFPEPSLEFQDDYSVRVVNGNNSIRFSFTDARLIEKSVITDYNRQFPVPPTICTFTLAWEDFSKVLKGASILGATHVTVSGKNGSLYMSAEHSNISDSYTQHIGDCDIDFTAEYKIDTLKLIPDNYEVEITSKLVSKFTGSKVSYFVVTDIKQN